MTATTGTTTAQAWGHDGPCRRRMGLVAPWLVATSLWAGCEGPDPDAPQRLRAEARSAARTEPAGAEESHEEVGRSPVVIEAREGDVARLRGRSDDGAALEVGDGLRLGEGASARIGLEGGATVALRAGASLEVEGDGFARLLLLGGAFELRTPDEGSALRMPLRVATPAASLELSPGTVAVVHVHPAGAVWVAAFEGRVTVWPGDVDARRRPRSLDVDAGRALPIGARGPGELVEGPMRLDEAAAAGVTALEAVAEPDAERLGRELTEAGARVDEALLWLEAEARRGRSLTGEHRSAAGQGRTEDTARLQRDLQTHAQTMYALRQVASVRWERLRATERVARRLDRAGPEATEIRRDRALGVLGG